jgi:hypothetical protein
MADFEKIVGQKAVDLLLYLIKAKTLVKASIINKDYDRLTVVLGIRVEKTGHIRFQIDPPEGFWGALKKLHRPRLRFDFLSRDRLPHRFDVPFEDGEDEGWLPGPEVIRRYQLRNDFRLNAPVNAYATALINDAEFRMALDNISLGGFFCHCPNSAKALLFKDQIIENLSLVLVLDGEYQMVSIDRAIIRRIEGWTRQRHFGIAFEIAQINSDTQRRLVQLVYGLQREYLKMRQNEE